MKAIAYNIKPQEKERLILANHKKHDITIITNSLTLDTLDFANGKEALIVFNNDILSADLIKGLQSIGIKYLATASFGIDHIDLKAVAEAGLKLANVPFKNGNEMESMYQVIKNLDNWAQGKCVENACCCQNNCTDKPLKKS